VSTVAVCIPTIPTRERLLARAVQSVGEQTRPPDEVRVAIDDQGLGAAQTRNLAWQTAAPTDWVAFLDDDDVLRNRHLERLLHCAEVTKADLIYPWFNIVNAKGEDMTNRDPLRIQIGQRRLSPFGLPFGPEHETELRTRNNFIPVTVLIRRSLLEETGGFPSLNSPEWPENCCEDWGLWRRLLDVGATFAHLPERTWLWTWHGTNTSGRPWKKTAAAIRRTT
jgi:hypothetical protein